MSEASRRILLEGGTIVTMDPRRSVVRGDLLIEGHRIAALGPLAKGKKKIDEVVDCQGRLVIPGLIQPHTHLCQTLFRGQADDLELLDWLAQRIWPFEAAHDEASLYCSSLIGGAELLRSGTTAILDMGTVRHTDAIFRAAKKLGLRATIGKAMMDSGQNLPAGLRETTEASLKESLALHGRWHGTENGRLRYAFAPRFVLSCTETLLRQVVVEARARGLLIHTHASENSGEIEAVRARCGADNVAYLHQLGMSGPDTVLAHCVWLTSGEQRILADTGTHVAHCPSSNLKLASGFAKIPDLLGLGINVGLAADGAPCNNNLDAFMEMRLAGLIHKPRFGPTAMPARTVFELATLGGAKALGLSQQIGSLEIGKQADVTVVDPRTLNATPASDPYSMLVYALTGRDVEHVFVDGLQRVKKGKVLGLNLQKLSVEAEKHSGRIRREVLGAAPG
ncbi:MAG: 5'-deoxyadenosine deaminase [Deltaproteobacteria bacterium]|nr:5'-deoxyadenosine deaminase [Deltaproteobacteria bacterium]